MENTSCSFGVRFLIRLDHREDYERKGKRVKFAEKHLCVCLERRSKMEHSHRYDQEGGGVSIVFRYLCVSICLFVVCDNSVTESSMTV